MNEMPVLKLELNSLKHTIQMTMSNQMDEITKYIQEATDKYCTEENLQEMIDQQVKESIDYTVKQVIENHYRHGDGMKIIKETILRQLGES